MPVYLTFYPLGNADSMLIDLADGRKVLIDYAAVRESTEGEKRCDLPTELRRDLEQSGGRNDFDAVCITHLDSDHCRGFGKFFWLDHDVKYQGEGRIKIWELWVPAAAILEENLKDEDACLVQAEAQHRLRNRAGVLVFSQPAGLREWIEKYRNFEDVEDLIVNAGETVPGYSLTDPEQAEFFVHSPFGWWQDQKNEIDRDEDSIIMQVAFIEGGNKSRLLLPSDANFETLNKIVQATIRNQHKDRLYWDMMKLPHHCSYRSLGPEPGDDETVPSEGVKMLFEEYRKGRGVFVSTSMPIPTKGSDEDGEFPPHRQAANYYQRILEKSGGEFVVTMEQPDEENPKPIIYIVTDNGIELDVNL